MADSLSVRHMCSVCLYHVVRGGGLSVGDAVDVQLWQEWMAGSV